MRSDTELLIVLTREQSKALRARLPRTMIRTQPPSPWPMRLAWGFFALTMAALATHAAWPFLSTFDLSGVLP